MAAFDDEVQPYVLPVVLDDIPAQLIERDQWVLWSMEKRAGKWTKPPISIHTHGMAKSNAPATWATFEKVRPAVSSGAYAGLGYVFSVDDPYFFLDLDHCRDPDSGAIAPWALAYLEGFYGTYIEVSPSGTGIKVIGEGVLPGTQHTKSVGENGAKIEMFDQVKYSTITGHRLDGAAHDVMPCQAALDALYERVFGQEDVDPFPEFRATAAAPEPISDDDEAILAKARASRKGDRIVRLIDQGDISAYGNNRSSADQAACNDLAFWFQKDPVRMDRVFRKTPLYRPKWDNVHHGDGRTYGQGTIDKAIAGCADAYTPAAPRPHLQAVPRPGEPPATMERGAPPPVEVIPWPERQELPVSDPTPTLPAGLIPSPLRTWMSDMADISRLPLEMIAAPAIVGLGAIIGRSIGIRPWHFNDFIVAPNLWGCVVSRPGWMKSFAVAEGLKPIGRLAAAAHDEYEAEREKAEAKTAVIESVMEDLKRRMRAAAKDDDDVKMEELQGKFLGKVKELKEASPTERRYMTHDATIEKLAELLRDNPKGMLVVRDELYGLLRSFEKSGRENDRQFYLEGWSGTGSFTSDRIARGTIHVPALTLSIIGSIQPGRLRGIVDEAAAGGGGDDGLLQRFQVTVWPDRLEPWVKPSRWPDGDARDAAFGIFKALDEINPYGIQAKQERAGTIPYLQFTPIAQGVADEWHDELEHRLRSDVLDASPAFASHLSKYRSLMPSLALLFHLVGIAAGETSGGPVSEGPTKLACDWCDFLEAHARKIYDVELDRGKSAARALATKIQAAAIIDGQTVRDIYRHQWSGLKSDEIVIDGLKVLADHGWVRLESVPSGPTGGRTSQVLRLHPTLIEGSPS